MKLKIGFLIMCAYIGLCIGSCLAGLSGCGRLHGPEGASGVAGTPGSNGADGHDGAMGHTGAQGPQGETGAQGEQGQDGSQGPQGEAGQQGAVGPQGPAGADGQAGTVVTSVQFCDGPTTYPTSFPEYGLCIADRLYAVYWMGGNAWLSEVVPGAYSSTSSSVACNFTVEAHCRVTHD